MGNIGEHIYDDNSGLTFCGCKGKYDTISSRKEGRGTITIKPFLGVLYQVNIVISCFGCKLVDLENAELETNLNQQSNSDNAR